MKAILLAIVTVAAVLALFYFASQKSSTTSPVIDLTIAPSPTATITQAPAEFPTPTTSQETTLSATISAVPEVSTATIKTSKGSIVIKLFPQEAPNTVANLAKKAQDGSYENLTFHRVEDWVIQGGDPQGDGTGGGKMSTELNDKPFITGSLGVARGPDIKISNDAQFFITKSDASWLNKQYTNFGVVTKGIDVVNKIEIGDKILEITVQ